jgi:hypothetical protein
MVRKNMLGRQDALQKLQKDNDVPLDFIAAFTAEHGINFSELSKGLDRFGTVNELNKLSIALLACIFRLFSKFT